MRNLIAMAVGFALAQAVCAESCVVQIRTLDYANSHGSSETSQSLAEVLNERVAVQDGLAVTPAMSASETDSRSGDAVDPMAWIVDSSVESRDWFASEQFSSTSAAVPLQSVSAAAPASQQPSRRTVTLGSMGVTAPAALLGAGALAGLAFALRKRTLVPSRMQRAH